MPRVRATTHKTSHPSRLNTPRDSSSSNGTKSANLLGEYQIKSKGPSQVAVSGVTDA
jgi:hypothetical protein